ncbi:hypothetical protein QUF90_08670 [Desulfococcaceae bacterium HSG9]|nr:hypothetical protein [Desulfococcaceae bacterium HSG9]
MPRLKVKTKIKRPRLKVKTKIKRSKPKGTKMFCPSCEEHRKCEAVSVAKISCKTDDYEQRKYIDKHDDIKIFQRGRICSRCQHEFITYEVDSDLIWELVELRESLSKIKQHAEKYKSESNKASKSLSKLSNSLNILQALKIYKSS